MIAQDVARLVGMAAEVDPRMPELDSDGLRVWFGLLADVPFPLAAEALVAHYRSTDATITPHVLVTAWKAEQRRARSQAFLEESRRRGPKFDPATVRNGIDRCVAALAAAKGLELDAAEGEATWRRQVLDERCPHCGAGERQPCTSGGQPLRKRFAHPGREEAARAALGFSSA